MTIKQTPQSNKFEDFCTIYGERNKRSYHPLKQIIHLDPAHIEKRYKLKVINILHRKYSASRG